MPFAARNTSRPKPVWRRAARQLLQFMQHRQAAYPAHQAFDRFPQPLLEPENDGCQGDERKSQCAQKFLEHAVSGLCVRAIVARKEMAVSPVANTMLNAPEILIEHEKEP